MKCAGTMELRPDVPLRVTKKRKRTGPSVEALDQANKAGLAPLPPPPTLSSPVASSSHMPAATQPMFPLPPAQHHLPPPPQVGDWTSTHHAQFPHQSQFGTDFAGQAFSAAAHNPGYSSFQYNHQGDGYNYQSQPSSAHGYRPAFNDVAFDTSSQPHHPGYGHASLYGAGTSHVMPASAYQPQ